MYFYKKTAIRKLFITTDSMVKISCILKVFEFETIIIIACFFIHFGNYTIFVREISPIIVIK